MSERQYTRGGESVPPAAYRDPSGLRVAASPKGVVHLFDESRRSIDGGCTIGK